VAINKNLICYRRKRNETFFVGNFLMDIFNNNSFSRRSTYEEIFTENSVLIFL
jgi:hypothetical protein